MRGYAEMRRDSHKRNFKVGDPRVIVKDVEADMGYEVITIMNQGTGGQSLWGWALATLDGPFVFKIPSGVTLMPGDALRVACGSPKLISNEYDLIWKRHRQLNAEWDVILLIDASGKVVDGCRYGRAGERGAHRNPHYAQEIAEFIGQDN